MAIKIIEGNNLKWINIDQVDEEALTYLKENHKFHQLDIDDIQGESQTPKIDVYKNYLFLVLQLPQWNQTTQTVQAHEVDIFVGADYLITIQHTKSKQVKNFFYRCLRNRSVKKEWMSDSSGHLLSRITEALFHNTKPIIDSVGKHISRVEQEIFDGEQDTRIIKQLAIHRRSVLSLRRIIDPQRYLVANLSHTRKAFLDESTSLYFDNVSDYLNKIWAILDTYKDTINGLHVTVESLINQRTNKVISALTIISVSLLPLTLLAGIYGMNIAGLPLADNPVHVWAIFGAVASFIILVIVFMKHKKWI